MDERELIKYFKSLGLEVYTTTKARGHQGFFMQNRIDISKNLPQGRIVPTLLHEFAHYIHYKLEKDMCKTGGTLKVLFGADNSEIKAELIDVTHFVDESSLCVKLYEHRHRVREKIKEYEGVIKKEYPNFLRSRKFGEFDRYIRRSRARYLLKYDRVKLIGGFFGTRREILTIENIERDFPDMPLAFCAYIRLRSMQRRQTRISARINKFKKYYERPTELFARFVEALYLDSDWTSALAPNTVEIFKSLLQSGYYMELATVLKLCGYDNFETLHSTENPPNLS